VRSIPISAREYDSMIACEELRNETSYRELRDDCLALAGRFAQIRNSLSGPSGSGSRYEQIIPRADFFEYRLFTQNESVTRKLLTVAGGEEWFTRFMTGWIENADALIFTSDAIPSAQNPRTLAGGNLYDDANLRLNALIKRAVGKLIVRNAELTASRVSALLWAQDSERKAVLNEAELLNSYVFLLDRRNMPVFPANDSAGQPRYIPKDEYFMMGDNRFNSLDMRHSYDDVLSPLTNLDPMPVYYYSNMEPRSVHAQKILGSPVLRIWPPARFGLPGVTGKRYAAE
jgi:signal peptidase I